MVVVVLGAGAAYNIYMSPEGSHLGKRVSKERAAERDWRLVDLPDLEREYEGVLAHERMLNERLRKGNEHTLQTAHPDLKKAGAELGAEVARELQRVLERKAELAGRIKTAGGNPPEHTIQ